MAIIEYPIEDGKFDRVDTEDPDLSQRAEWGKQILGAESWRIAFSTALYVPGVPDSAQPGGTVLFQSANVVYRFPIGIDPGTGHLEQDYPTEVRGILRHPVETVKVIAHQLNIAVPDDLEFTDPDDTAPKVEDWDVPGSPIGQPLASKPGYFHFKNTGQPEGFVYTGKSGAKYKLVVIGGFAFFRAHAWQLLT